MLRRFLIIFIVATLATIVLPKRTRADGTVVFGANLSQEEEKVRGAIAASGSLQFVKGEDPGEPIGFVSFKLPDYPIVVRGDLGENGDCFLKFHGRVMGINNIESISAFVLAQSGTERAFGPSKSSAPTFHFWINTSDLEWGDNYVRIVVKHRDNRIKTKILIFTLSGRRSGDFATEFPFSVQLLKGLSGMKPDQILGYCRSVLPAYASRPENSRAIAERLAQSEQEKAVLLARVKQLESQSPVNQQEPGKLQQDLDAKTAEVADLDDKLVKAEKERDQANREVERLRKENEALKSRQPIVAPQPQPKPDCEPKVLVDGKPLRGNVVKIEGRKTKVVSVTNVAKPVFTITDEKEKNCYFVSDPGQYTAINVFRHNGTRGFYPGTYNLLIEGKSLDGESVTFLIKIVVKEDP